MLKIIYIYFTSFFTALNLRNNMYLKKKIAREISFIIVEVTIAPSSSHHHRNRHFHKMSGRQQKTFLFPKLVTRTCTRTGYTFLVQICYAKKVLPEKN